MHGCIKALSDTSVQNENDRFLKNAGIKTIRIHDFRHFHTSLLANEAINIQEIARRLGHSDISMTVNHFYDHTAQSSYNSVKTRNCCKIYNSSLIFIHYANNSPAVSL
ncbi:MAG: tyrosine-type recombinase/integrase [Ruminococcus sp.]